MKEIEAKDLETIHKFSKLLGFSEGDHRPWSSTDLIKHYSKK